VVRARDALKQVTQQVLFGRIQMSIQIARAFGQHATGVGKAIAAGGCESPKTTAAVRRRTV